MELVSPPAIPVTKQVLVPEQTFLFKGSCHITGQTLSPRIDILSYLSLPVVKLAFDPALKKRIINPALLLAAPAEEKSMFTGIHTLAAVITLLANRVSGCLIPPPMVNVSIAAVSGFHVTPLLVLYENILYCAPLLLVADKAKDKLIFIYPVVGTYIYM